MKNPDETKEAFSNQLAPTLQNTPLTDKLLLMGDFNARIGQDYNKWPMVIGKPKFEHVTPLLNQLHWLPVSERITYKTLLYVYKSLNGLSPQYIQDCLVVKTPSSDMMRTRSTDSINFVVPVTKKCAGDRAFLVAAPYLWNRLPVHIRNATSLNLI